MDNQSSPNGTKRDFLKYALSGGILAWLAAIFYPILAYLNPPKVTGAQVTSVKVGKIGDFENDSGTIFRFGNQPGILIKTKDGEFKAFSATCTHLDCTVQYRQDMGLIWCACHNGRYDLSGRNIAGPPPRPLEAYNVIIKNDEILVTKS